MMDAAILRARVRDLLERGVIPKLLPLKVWVGASAGRDCFICEESITPGHVECEVDLASTVTAHVHRRCFDVLVAATNDEGLEGLKEA